MSKFTGITKTLYKWYNENNEKKTDSEWYGFPYHSGTLMMNLPLWHVKVSEP